MPTASSTAVPPPLREASGSVSTSIPDDTAHAPAPARTATPLQRKAALWALGDIVSSGAGLRAVLDACPDFATHVDAAARGLRLTKRIRSFDAEGAATAASPLPGRQFWYDASVEAIDDAGMRWVASAVLARMARARNDATDASPAPLGALLTRRLGWEAELVTAGAPAELDESAATALSPVLSRPIRLTIASSAPASNLALLDATVHSLAVDDSMMEGAFLAAAALPHPTAEWQAVLKRVTELSSRITQREARTALLSLRGDNPELFAAPGLYMHVHALLSRYNVGLPVRRFVHNLFERVSFSDRAWELLVVRSDGAR